MKSNNSAQQVALAHVVNLIVLILLKKLQRNNYSTKASKSYTQVVMLELYIFLGSKQHLTVKRLKDQQDLRVELKRYCKAIHIRTTDLNNISSSNIMAVIEAEYNHYTSKIICKRFPLREVKRRVVSIKHLIPIKTTVITILNRIRNTHSTPVLTW